MKKAVFENAALLSQVVEWWTEQEKMQSVSDFVDVPKIANAMLGLVGKFTAEKSAAGPDRVAIQKMLS